MKRTWPLGMILLPFLIVIMGLVLLVEFLTFSVWQITSRKDARIPRFFDWLHETADALLNRWSALI